MAGFGRMYGRMDPNQIPSAPMVSCAKCKGLFSAQKSHQEVTSLESVTKKVSGFYRLCPNCGEKLKAWMGTK